MNRFPLLPLEEEGHLSDMPLRENVIERVYNSPEPGEGASYRWTEILENEATPGALVKFHTAHKLTLLVRPGNGTRTGSPQHYTEMGRLVADAGKRGGICQVDESPLQ